MGSWFSNIHIRKTETTTKEAIAAAINKLMAARHFLPVASETDADGVVAILDSENCQWISVYSDLLLHDDPQSCMTITMPISAELRTDVLGISCFDSDYLYLHLINAEDKTDAWIGIGRGADVGIERRTGVTAWKKKVVNYPSFSAAAKQKYICADEFLVHAAPSLGLSVQESMKTVEMIKESAPENKVEYLYFQRTEEFEERELPQLLLTKTDADTPCMVGTRSVLNWLSDGVGAYGLSVYFLGPGIENDTLTFSEVCLGSNGRCLPITLTKMQLPDGQWAYGYHDPDFPIPAGASKRLKREKQWMMLWEKRIELQFIPHGDPRKMLDIAVVLVVDQYPQRQFRWNVWQPWGTKKAFIDHHNKLWKWVRRMEGSADGCLPLLREEDFD